jgi:hypothetical protein
MMVVVDSKRPARKVRKLLKILVPVSSLKTWRKRASCETPQTRISSSTSALPQAATGLLCDTKRA